MKVLMVLFLLILLLSTTETSKSLKKVLAAIKEIEKNMLTVDEMKKFKKKIVDEIIDALTPIIEDSCSCCEKNKTAILIVGGLPEQNSVQALDQDGNFLCDLPDVPKPFGRYGATMDGNILCGGVSSGGLANLEQNCIYYHSGTWVTPWITPPSFPLNEPRVHAVSWGRQNPPLNVAKSHIFGGVDSPDTSEIAYETGTSGGSDFSYNYVGASGSCSIQFENYVIIIGGLINSVGSQSVEKYDDTGFLNSLPDIGTQRTYAACGYYYKNGDLVYLVTGGTRWIPYTILDTTELSVNEGAWSTLPPSANLPTPTTGLRGVSLNNNVFVTGGNDDNGKIGDVLQWDRDMEKWIPKSSIIPRNFHTVSVLPLTDVEPYCL